VQKLDGISLLVDNAQCYHSKLLSRFCDENKILKKHSIRYVPATRAKIESFFRTLKLAMKSMELNSLAKIEEFLVEFIIFYNNQRPHGSINDLPPASVYYGTEESIHRKRAQIKDETDAIRRQANRMKQALST